MAELSEKLGLEAPIAAARKVHNAIRNVNVLEGMALIEVRDRAVVEAVARWLSGPEAEEEIGAVGDIAAQAIRDRLLSRPEPEGGRGESGAERCPSIGPDHLRCGLKAGHGGRHTALTESGTRWPR